MVTPKSPKRKKTATKVNHNPTGEPRYLAVFNQLCQDITDGVYQVGELLPTEHELHIVGHAQRRRCPCRSKPPRSRA